MGMDYYYPPGRSDYFNFLAHHGIKNQRWGIRRYQNPDGSLTEAGRKRYRKLSEKQDRLEAERKRLVGDNQPKKTPNPHGKKSIFDMSDDELNAEINRLGIEKKYRDLMKDLYPKPKKERYFNGRKVVSDMLTGGLTAAGKNIVENVAGNQANKLGRKLGLEYDVYTKSKKSKKKDDED